tara:strand:+ start:172 stop:597 length:426 start_codon:yes stop_codon:yes gene_type:complete
MKTFNSKKSGVRTSDIDSAGALDIDAGSGNVSIDSASGSITMGSTLTDGQTLKLGKNGATEMIFTPHGTAGSEKISLTNTGGDAADAITITSTAGGITLNCGEGKLKLTLAAIGNVADGDDAGLSAGTLYRTGTNLLIAEG